MTLCPEPQASEGKLSWKTAWSGTVQALTGPGADPFLVTNGKVYLTGGYKGAPFGLSIVVPAVAGPYTLAGTNGKGDVVVRAAINVDKEDAQSDDHGRSVANRARWRAVADQSART